MFKDRRNHVPPFRSEERNSSRVVKLYLNSAPPNGKVRGLLSYL